jgi:hypothetical protein
MKKVYKNFLYKKMILKLYTNNKDAEIRREIAKSDEIVEREIAANRRREMANSKQNIHSVCGAVHCEKY